MSDESHPHRSLESLRKEAKRWRAALRAGDADARARFERVLGRAPESPSLRDVQHALARERGHAGWPDLRRAVARASRVLATYDDRAAALLEAYRTGTPRALARHQALTWHRRSWATMRTYVQLHLGRRPAGPDDPVDITLEDARWLVAREHGFADWADLRTFAQRPARPDARLEAHGQMTDAMLGRVAAVEGVTSLALGGSKHLGDAGVRELARLPSLRHLDLSGTAVTDSGLEFLKDLPDLETLSLAGTRVTDAGAQVLRHCRHLREVDLGGTMCGDGALRALAGMPALAWLHTGESVTDDGIPLLHELPVFRTWRDGAVEMALLSYRSSPNQLTLRGSFTDAGMRRLRGLDGLFGLNVDDARLAITSAAVEPLRDLPHLGWLAIDAKDDWMPAIAELPSLRFLGVQDTPAGDDGFAALGRSRTLEYLWGRRCHNLGSRGFRALAGIPTLRGLSVSCRNVGDDGIAALPDFPALRELMPIDVRDPGYRHIGRCERLASLILMYCRDTTDAATEHITGLRHLTYYFNSYTTITDRTPALLSTLTSLERITFDQCHGLTDAGIRRLAKLPRLRELSVSGRGVTARVGAGFPPGVRVTRPM